MSRLTELTFRNGLMKLVRQMMPPSANSLATSDMRRICSAQSCGLKPRFLLIPCRMLSACRQYAGMPILSKYSSVANEMVLFPAPIFLSLINTLCITYAISRLHRVALLCYIKFNQPTVSNSEYTIFNESLKPSL